MKSFKRGSLVLLILSLVFATSFLVVCCCPPLEASVSPFPAFQMNHDHCRSNQASACVPMMLQAHARADETVIAPQGLSLGSLRLLTMTVVIPFDHEKTSSLHDLSSRVTIPQPLFPKNQVLRI